ncbi:MAG: periplasmic heavy metal sensor [Candidatus Krumholzibacteria bacterium]|nr:periplasmic heavy metal sensor [Candidatus Krumholzibacteria bacterium]
MSKRSLKAILVVSLAFNLAVVATVAVGLVSRDGKTGNSALKKDADIPIDDHGRQLSESLGLSGEQARCFEQVMAEKSDKAKKIREKLEKERQDLFHLLQEKTPDEQAIMARVDSIAGLQGDLEKFLVKRLIDSRMVLSPEEDERLLYFIRCSMSPGCIGKDKCSYTVKKDGSE